MLPTFALPTLRFRGLRAIDDFGGGGYGAPRSRDGAHYAHKGLDILSNPGDGIVAPMAGRVSHVGRAYKDPGSDLCSLHIVSGSVLVKMLYAKPIEGIVAGCEVVAGQDIAVAQDVSGYHSRPSRRMDNHLHIEIYLEGVLHDPTTLLPIPATPIDAGMVSGGMVA